RACARRAPPRRHGRRLNREHAHRRRRKPAAISRRDARARGTRMDARSRHPLRAGTAERDRRHPPPLHDDAGRDRHSRRTHPGRRTAGGFGPRLDARDPRGPRRHDAAPARPPQAAHDPKTLLAVLLPQAQRHPLPDPRALGPGLRRAARGGGHHKAARTSRWSAAGSAARNGLSAALGAQRGFPADRKLFEGRVLPDVLGVTPDISAFTDGLGERIALTEVSFKPWCAARQTMAATQALKDIVASGVAPAAIDEVAVSVLPPHLKMIDHGVVAGDRAAHLTSVQYAMAAAARAPEMAFEVQQTPPDLPPAMRGLMAKIKVEADARLLADYPVSWPARVRVAAGSARHERDVTHVPGDPALPFDRESVRKKFLRFTQPVLGAENTELILARCSGVLATGAFSQLIDDIEQACSVDACSPSGRGHCDSGNQDSSVSTRR